MLRRGYCRGLGSRLSHELRQGGSFNEVHARNAESVHGISRALSHHAPVRPLRTDMRKKGRLGGGKCSKSKEVSWEGA